LTFVDFCGKVCVCVEGDNMLGSQRQNEIEKILSEKGAVTVADLVEKFSVSIETVRRDLLAMEKKKMLTRVHGGAMLNPEMKPFRSLEMRNEENVEGKRQLAKKACEFIEEGDYIAIDEGSTAIILAEQIKENFKNLTIVTYSLDVFDILRKNVELNVILTGGFFNPHENAFYGNLVLDALDKIHVSKSFIFPTAVSLEFGIGDYHSDLYSIQKKFFEIADKKFILADSSKFEKKALLKVDDMKEEYMYITDSKLPPSLEKLYKENGISVFKG